MGSEFHLVVKMSKLEVAGRGLVTRDAAQCHRCAQIIVWVLLMPWQEEDEGCSNCLPGATNSELLGMGRCQQRAASDLQSLETEMSEECPDCCALVHKERFFLSLVL